MSPSKAPQSVPSQAKGHSHRPYENRYEVQGEIASGGMGVVHRVRDRITGQLLALKRIATHCEKTPGALERFEREYQVLSSLDHPRIVRVFDYGIDDSGPYYTMELLEGHDLVQLSPLPFKTACMHLRDIATSLALLHGRRLLHRDLSPSNVRVMPDGHCTLLDFGALAPFGQAPDLVGTPPIMAPEVLATRPLDQRTDLYALGALAYYMLAGRHAFFAHSALDLPEQWTLPLAAPSSLAKDVPRELDALVLSLLSRDPLARPGSAAEVITRLEVIGDLPPEDRNQARLFASSYFTSPRFSGRAAELRELTKCLDAALLGHGAAVLIEAAPGMGRTRLLEELAVRARMSGAIVVSIDASSAQQRHGTAHALVSRLFQLLPQTAAELAPGFAIALAEIGLPAESDSSAAARAAAPRSLAELVVELSRDRPVVIAVDNVDDADAASQGLLAALASMTGDIPLTLILGAALASQAPYALGSLALRRHCSLLTLVGLARHELLSLLRSIFGDAPNLERFSEWLHELTAGGPLHAIEVCRSLFRSGVIHYASGIWTLPRERPTAELPMALGDALARRIDPLSAAARALAECLSLQRDSPSLVLCTLLCGDAPEPENEARALLEELTQTATLLVDRGVYRFSSSALRAAVLAGMSGQNLLLNHRRLGNAFAQLAAASDYALQVEAGFHLIQGGDDLRGAEMIAEICKTGALRKVLGDLSRAGRPFEAALEVYRRHHKSAYQLAPLFAGLALAGYYEERRFGEVYGDQALDLLSRLLGLDTARRLRPYVGKALALLIGVSLAFLRFLLTPRELRPSPFRSILEHCLGSVHALAGTSALSLDAERTGRIAATLEPFTFLPDRTTPVGIHQYGTHLAALPRENQVETYAGFERMLRRFEDLSYYRKLPADARAMLVAGLHYARGSLAVFRADGSAALTSAQALETIGIKMHAMIASQLRYLYYVARGELVKAEPHREQLEIHAASVGGVWQVETWEGAALILINVLALDDVVSLARISRQLEVLSRSVPSLQRYSKLASLALIASHRDERFMAEARAAVSDDVPRSYIGWAAVQSALARTYNQTGEPATAKRICERALAHVTDQDREFVALFLPLDLEMALAEAGLGQVEAGLARVDGLLSRFARCEHPLLQGLLHECRARIAWNAGRFADYQHSLSEVERWFRPTGTPALIAKYERLAGLAADGRS